MFGSGLKYLMSIKSIKGKKSLFIIYETVIQISSHYFWLWIVTELIRRTIPGMHISEERNMVVGMFHYISCIKIR
jgi:hypothetical protein